MLHKLKNMLYNFYYSKKKKIIIGNDVTIRNTTFYGYNYIGDHTIVLDSVIGFASYIAGHSNISKISIGKYCSIGQNVKNRYSLHPSRDFVSTHPAFYSVRCQVGFSFVNVSKFEENKYADNASQYFCMIGNDVWIGSDVSIMKGIKIGDGAIIATGSVVTRDIEPYEVVGGVPAKRIRMRFSEQDIKFLKELKWWNFSYERLDELTPFFENISDLRSVIKDTSSEQ